MIISALLSLQARYSLIPVRACVCACERKNTNFTLYYTVLNQRLALVRDTVVVVFYAHLRQQQRSHSGEIACLRAHRHGLLVLRRRRRRRHQWHRRRRRLCSETPHSAGLGLKHRHRTPAATKMLCVCVCVDCRAGPKIRPSPPTNKPQVRACLRGMRLSDKSMRHGCRSVFTSPQPNQHQPKLN